MGLPRPLFVYFRSFQQTRQFFVYFRSFQQTRQFLQKTNVKICQVHPVYGAGIRTHDVLNMTRLNVWKSLSRIENLRA